MAGEQIDIRTLRIILIVMCFLSGCGMIAIGVTNFTYGNADTPIRVMLSIYYILFGLLAWMGELPVPRLTQYVSFMRSYWGKALYFLFMGTISLNNDVIWHLIVSLFIIGVSVFYFLMAFSFRNRMNPEEEHLTSAAKKKPEADAKPPELSPPPANQV